MAATYLYAIMAGDEPLDLGRIGLPDGSSPVHAVTAAGMAALVGNYDGPPVAEMPRDQILRLLIMHQSALEQVGDNRPLLPAKFGTILTSENEARGILTQFQKRLKTALEDAGTAVEVDLSATWDLAGVIEELSRVPDLASAVEAARQQAAQDPLAARLEIGQLVQQSVEGRREEYRRRVVGQLVRVVRDAQPNPRPTDDVVFNVAFLVERGDLSAFDETVDVLGEELEGQLRMRYVGPLPPYSFGTVEITRPDPVRVGASRDLLGLGESTTPDELQQAYRRRAAAAHPDVNQQDPTAEFKFAGLTAAYDELMAFLEGGSDGEAGADTRYDLTDDAIRRAVLLEIKREPVQVGEPLVPEHEPRVGA